MLIDIKGCATLALAAGIGVAALPSRADAGFLDQLFGGAFEPSQQMPSGDYAQPAPTPQLAPLPARPRRKLVVDDKPKLQKPTDLMHDTTLQNGDAVMTKDGLRIYTGDDGASRHSKADFDAIGDLDGMPKSERAALVALDTTRNDPLRHGAKPDTVASGRSASVAVPISAGHPIVDARGKTIRYIGP